MYLRWNDFDRTLSVMEDLRRRMDAAFNAQDQGREQAGLLGYGGGSQWPNVTAWDAGQNLVLTADVPGMSDKDVQLSIHQDVLTLSGERSAEPPEGYTAERVERGRVKFSRSFSLPTRVDPDKVTAEVKAGVLTVIMPKHPDAQPRKIAVKQPS
jgi:HSP20 family protein